MSVGKRFNPDKLYFRTHLSGKTHLFLDKICLKVYSEACPDDKPVRASSRTYFERILGAYFERMAGCIFRTHDRVHIRVHVRESVSGGDICDAH